MNNKILELINKVKQVSPLVHNITNYVTMNNSANALLSVGASPIMSHSNEEVEDMIGICSSLVINIGTLDTFTVESMLLALKTANKLGKPVILDPVGAGATPFRNKVLNDILASGKIDYIRGNGSEIIALNGIAVASRGVDSSMSSMDSLETAKILSKKTGAIVCVSGETDIIVYGDKIGFVDNGSTLMTKVTALGCSSSAILGAFAALEGDKFELAIASTALMGICGEIAAEMCSGPGTLQLHLLDKLYNVTETEILERIKVRINE